MIVLDNVKKVYRPGTTDLTALRGISLEVKKGEFVAVMGPSGSGKSTLLNIIGCLDQPTSGAYIFEGKNLSEVSKNELSHIRAKKIGFIFQVYNLLPRLTAVQNVALGLVYAGIPLSERSRIARHTLQELGLGKRLFHQPNELSGGEQQRVAIARALAKGLCLILADEPTGNIDTKTGIEVMTIFKKIHQRGVTIILVTHNSEIAQWAQRTIYIKDGVIVSSLHNHT